MKERILVTGGTGYIGSHTVVELQNNGYDVVIVDNLSNSRADVVDNIEKITGIRPAFEEVDCLDYAKLEPILKAYEGLQLKKAPLKYKLPLYMAKNHWDILLFIGGFARTFFKKSNEWIRV